MFSLEVMVKMTLKRGPSVPSRCFSEFSSLKVRLEQDIIGHRAGLKGEGLVDDSGPAQCYGLVLSFLKVNPVWDDHANIS